MNDKYLAHDQHRQRDQVHLVNAPVHHELIVTQSETDAYFGLDGTGKRIWELLDSPTTIGSLCDRLSAEFDVEPNQIEPDVIAFLTELKRQDLIQVGQ